MRPQRFLRFVPRCGYKPKTDNINFTVFAEAIASGEVARLVWEAMGNDPDDWERLHPKRGDDAQG